LRINSRAVKAVPVVASIALVLAACGSSGSSSSVAQQPAAADAGAPAAAAPAAAAPAAAPAAAAPAAADTAAAPAAAAAAPAAAAPAAAAPAAGKTKSEKHEKAAPAAHADMGAAPAAAPDMGGAHADKGAKADKGVKADKGGHADKGAPSGEKAGGATGKADSVGGPVTGAGTTGDSASRTVIAAVESDAKKAENAKIADSKQGVTDTGITKDGIKLGSVNMHGMALGNVLTAPMVRGNLATATAINDRGGILGRRLSITDCDDGPGEVSRAKACIKKLAGQDQVFALVTGLDWATASIHDDLKQYALPYVGAWAYSQTEWQDPYMFPAYTSMIHEGIAGGYWAKNVIKPKTYGLICLTSPEMQLACNEVAKVLDAAGSKMVKKLDVSISETSMSAGVLAMRAANPDHVVHYVINPATMAKFMVESAQQGYFPPQGISGNHLGAEVLGSLFGKWPAGRYWTNTTFKLWGPEFMATMNKYARGNRGTNHHIVQAGYVGINIFAQAAKEVGPNLTRQRLMDELGNGTVWASDASLDQRFQYVPSERSGNNWNKEYGQAREFMYKYDSANTVSNPDGSPNGFTPDPTQFEMHTWK
jgi:substrate-binding family protein